MARGMSLVGYFGLLAVVSFWVLTRAPADRIPIVPVFLLAVVPLLALLRGVLHGRPRAHFWASVVALLYMAHGVVELLSADASHMLAALEVVLSLTLYFGAVFYARFRARALRAQRTVHADDPQSDGSA